MLAVEFSQTTAGWITGITTPIIAGLIGTTFLMTQKRFSRGEKRSDTIESALTEQSKALAVLLNEQSHLNIAVQGNTVLIKETAQKATALEATTEVLKAIVDRHEKWHERNSDNG